jgi:hypothetical protein
MYLFCETVHEVGNGQAIAVLFQPLFFCISVVESFWGRGDVSALLPCQGSRFLCVHHEAGAIAINPQRLRIVVKSVTLDITAIAATSDRKRLDLRSVPTIREAPIGLLMENDSRKPFSESFHAKGILSRLQVPNREEMQTRHHSHRCWTFDYSNWCGNVLHYWARIMETDSETQRTALSPKLIEANKGLVQIHAPIAMGITDFLSF